MQTAPLKSVCEIIMGQAPSGDTYNDEDNGWPLIAGASDFGELSPSPSRFTTSPSKLSKIDDIIICIRATIGDLNWSDKEYCLGRGVASLRVDERKADKNYIWRVVEYNAARLSALGRGATFKQISKPDIADFEIPLPPLEEQKRIAAILDQADDIRRKRQHSIDRLNQLGQAIFHEMFEAEIASPNRAALGDLVEDFRYGTSNKSSDSGYPTLRIPNVVRGEIDSSDLKTVPLDDAEFKRLKLFDGDVLFVRTNGNPDYVGRSAVFTLSQANSSDFESADWAYASYLIRARPRKAALNPWFLQAYLSHPRGKKSLKERSKTSAGQYNINTEGLGSIPIPISSIEKQISFATKIEDMGKIMQPLLVAAQDADSLFTSLQHRAFTGQL